MTELTQARLKELVSYNPETGVFVWKQRGDAERGWNQKYASKVAGWLGGKYWVIAIDRRCQTAQRLAWLYVYGYLPAHDTDHINNVKTDNRIVNLREATRSENSANRPPPKHNKSGFKGVHFDRGRHRWMAYIKKDWKRYHLGRFERKEDAIAAYERAAKDIYGEFARTA